MGDVSLYRSIPDIKQRRNYGISITQWNNGSKEWKPEIECPLMEAHSTTYEVVLSKIYLNLINPLDLITKEIQGTSVFKRHHWN